LWGFALKTCEFKDFQLLSTGVFFIQFVMLEVVRIDNSDWSLDVSTVSQNNEFIQVWDIVPQKDFLIYKQSDITFRTNVAVQIEQDSLIKFEKYNREHQSNTGRYKKTFNFSNWQLSIS